MVSNEAGTYTATPRAPHIKLVVGHMAGTRGWRGRFEKSEKIAAWFCGKLLFSDEAVRQQLFRLANQEWLLCALCGLVDCCRSKAVVLRRRWAVGHPTRFGCGVGSDGLGLKFAAPRSMHIKIIVETSFKVA